MDNQTFVKIAVIEELLAMLYETKFKQYPDPVAAVRNYAEYFQQKAEETSLPDVPAEVGMMIEGEIARFWNRVAERLLQSSEDPEQPSNG